MPATPAVDAHTTGHGVVLLFESFDPRAPEAEEVRSRPGEDTLLRVVDGLVRLSLADRERLLGIGDEVIVPAGTAHRLTGVAGRARVVMGFRAAA